MDKIDSALQAVKRIDDSPDLVDVMISIEDYLDRSDIYAFKNWEQGELVAGPYVDPYWIHVTFKWTYEEMPDPLGGQRLLPHGTQVVYRKSQEIVPQPIKTPNDYEPGTHKPKIKKETIWLVELSIPRRFVEDIDDAVLDLYDEKIDDAETVKNAEAEGYTEDKATAGQETP